MVKFSDGNVRRLEPATTPLTKQLNLLAYWDSEADAHHKAMRTAADTAQKHRAAIADLLKAAGVSSCWSDGTLYEINTLGELSTYDCPEACDVVAKAQPTDDDIDGAAYVQALVDAFQPDRIDEEVA
jgi:hypothetical protein